MCLYCANARPFNVSGFPAAAKIQLLRVAIEKKMSEQTVLNDLQMQKSQIKLDVVKVTKEGKRDDTEIADENINIEDDIIKRCPSRAVPLPNSRKNGLEKFI